MPTLTTSHVPIDPAALADLKIDWLCPIWKAWDTEYKLDQAESARARGFKVWSYISLEPYSPYPNWRLDAALMEARTIWWQVFNQKMDGFLYWGLNIWDRPHNSDIVDPARGPLLDFSICTGGDHDWLYGDGVLLYPGKDGPFGSIRLSNIRDGLQDYELLSALQNAQGEAAAHAACRPVASARDVFTTDLAVLMNQRREILAQLDSGAA